mmetsp:Transcript_105071/g.297291  ORF Transcript_105071/g.297291 Transcript_105071/m.297291 type:complete len:232 (-) Transcript_105071:132-827(-)
MHRAGGLAAQLPDLAGPDQEVPGERRVVADGPHAPHVVDDDQGPGGPRELAEQRQEPEHGEHVVRPVVEAQLAPGSTPGAPDHVPGQGLRGVAPVHLKPSVAAEPGLHHAEELLVDAGVQHRQVESQVRGVRARRVEQGDGRVPDVEADLTDERWCTYICDIEQESARLVTLANVAGDGPLAVGSGKAASAFCEAPPVTTGAAERAPVEPAEAPRQEVVNDTVECADERPA